jgi:hypothetical protein
MSEYSTDELVKRTMRHWAWWWEGAKDATGISGPEHGFQYRDAIIARLRAADTLCEAAKVTLDYLDDHFWENANIDESMAGERILTPLEKELKKAIADYEGKK